MQRRLVTIGGAAIIALSMTACPMNISGVVFLTPGHWSFEVSNVAQPVSIVLLANGTTANPPGGPPPGSVTFLGTLTWMQVDEAFTMTQDAGGGNMFQYTGTVFAETYMEGTFMQTAGGSASGIWTAAFVP